MELNEKKEYELTISLDTKGNSPEGFNREKLIEDFQAEILKLKEVSELTFSKNELPPPEGAQGDSIIQYILELLSDPENAKFYAKTLLYTLNQILSSYKINKNDDSEKKEAKGNKIIEAVILFMGKELTLPNLTKKIEDFLNDLDF